VSKTCFFQVLNVMTGRLNPLNAELNPICHLLALLGAHHILHVSRIRVKHVQPNCWYLSPAFLKLRLLLGSLKNVHCHMLIKFCQI